MEHVECMGKKTAHKVFLRKHHLEDLDIDGRITLRQTFKNSMEGQRLDLYDSRWGQVAVSTEQRNEPLGSIKCRKFLY
jgi:hypothetical protein